MCRFWNETVGKVVRAVWLFLNDQLSHGWQPRTWSGTPLPSCIHGSLRKHIGINWEDYVHCKSINLFWRYGYTSCLFGKWPSQNLQTSPSQDLASWTSNSANPCAPLWALLGASIGLLHGTTSSTSGTHACWNVLKCDEMCWPSWRQIMVRRCLEQHRQLANYIFNLLDNRSLKRAQAWTAGRRTRIGRPTHTHMGCANINWLPMAKFWRMEGNSNANRFLADTYGFLYWIFRRRSNESLNWIKFCCFPAPYEGCLRASRLDSTRLKNSVARIQTEWLGKPIVEFPWKTP